MNLRILTGIAVMAMLAGCCRYTDYSDDEDLTMWTSATVVYMGAPEVDGCGWLIEMGDEYYYPVNLEDEFRIQGLSVSIKYAYDPIEFRCGRGGTRYQSIRILAIKAEVPDVRTLADSNWDRIPMDGFRMDSAYVIGDFLHLQVSYSGGCRDHDFNLWKLPPNALDPPPVELMLSHDANEDMCEAYITEWLVFSLKPIRKRNVNEVKFLLRGSPEMSAYYGEFLYKY